MINQIYQLTKPKFINIKYQEEEIDQENHILIRPNYMAVCHADQRYYQGKRDPKILAKKLPMAMIHESCGTVISDPTCTYKVGQKVVMIPNQPPMQSDEEFYENYMSGTHFLSSGYDGFMREFVKITPDRLVKFNDIDLSVASILEFISVGFHAYDRFIKNSLENKETITIFGNGSLGFVMANVLKYKFPDSKIVVIGRNLEKLKIFSFVDEVYSSDDIPEDFSTDHGFECAGGPGSEDAINNIIKYIKEKNQLFVSSMFFVSNNEGKVYKCDGNKKKIVEEVLDLGKDITAINFTTNGRIIYIYNGILFSYDTRNKELISNNCITDEIG